VTLYFFALFIAHLFFYTQLFAPYPNPMDLVANKNDDFLFSVDEIMKDPTGIFWNNVPERIGDLIQMTGWIPFFICVTGFIHLFFKKRVVSLYLSLWFFVPLFIISFALKYFAARYMVFLATLIMLMTGYVISIIESKMVRIFLLTCIGISFLYLIVPILFDYQKLHFPSFERLQYVEGISSGYGITDMVRIAQKKSEDKPVIVLGEGIFGVGSNIFESGLPLHEEDIQVVGVWPLNKEVLQSYQSQLTEKHILVMMNFESIKKVPGDWPLKLIKEYKKPYDTTYFVLYELTNKR
jgi:4-amino-4-deoxy-L-arabinose transferase-like glycosyltransferase